EFSSRTRYYLVPRRSCGSVALAGWIFRCCLVWFAGFAVTPQVADLMKSEISKEPTRSSSHLTGCTLPNQRADRSIETVLIRPGIHAFEQRPELIVFGCLARLEVSHRSKRLDFHKGSRGVRLIVRAIIRIGRAVLIGESFDKQLAFPQVGGPALLVGYSDLLSFLNVVVGLEPNVFLAYGPARIAQVRVIPEHKGPGRQQVLIVRFIWFLGQYSNAAAVHNRERPGSEIDGP